MHRDIVDSCSLGCPCLTPRLASSSGRVSATLRWLCFRFADGDAYDVEICDYHYEYDEMSIPNDKPLMRRPTHPGEMLREDFLPDFGLTATKLAAAVNVSRQSINQLLRGRRAASPEMALRLGKLFGNSPEFWLGVQRAVDLWDAQQAIGEDVAGIETLQVASRSPRASGPGG